MSLHSALKSIFSNLQHFGGYTACTGVACPLPAFGGSIHPCYHKHLKMSQGVPTIHLECLQFPLISLALASVTKGCRKQSSDVLDYSSYTHA